jgi:hypothetical protein
MARYWYEAQGAPDEDTAATTGKHRTHMVFGDRSTEPYSTCPETHPIQVPSLRVILTFPIPSTTGHVTLSERDHEGLLTDQGSPTHMHADFWNTWQQDDLRFLVRECINNYPHATGRPEVCTAFGQADAD